MNQELDLTPFHITRPEKVRWYFPSGSTDILSNIPSKSTRDFLLKTDQILNETGMTWVYKPLSETEYLKWLPYYREKMTENSYDIIANEQWYAERIAEGFTIEALFFYQNAQLVGSGVLYRQANEEIRFAFKASERIKLPYGAKGSLGAIIDYIFLKEMIKQGIKKISGGKSRNAFGVINKTGYLDFWLRFGFYAEVAEDTSQLTTVPVNDQGSVAFFGLKEGRLSLYAYKIDTLGLFTGKEILDSSKINFTVLE